tara:strand:- start:3 stop:335 length:333 start_codon:yes stop_codon:yes gene_type:complete
MKLKNSNKNNKNDSLSKSSERKGNLLIQVDELMQKLENEYGPIMLEELQERLVKTINDFQDDVNAVLKDAFKNHHMKHEDLDNKTFNHSGTKDEDVPSFISDYEKKKNKK